MNDVLYGRTEMGQLIYDLGISDLSDQYLARKHHMRVKELRTLRQKIRKAIRGRKKLRLRRKKGA